MGSQEGPLKAVPRPEIKPTRPPFRRAKILSAVGAATVLTIHAVPHLFPQMNKRAFGMANQPDVPKNFVAMFKETCSKMGVKKPEEGDIFINSGFSTISAGSFDLPNKVVIGLPRVFLIDSPEKLRDSKIQFDNNQIDWDSKVGKSLEKALVVKNDHVAFAMAHELAHIRNYDFVYRSVFPAAWFYGTCRGMIWLVPRARNANSVGLKALLAVLLAGCSAYLYFEVIKLVKKRFELHADKNAVKLGLQYCNGGISYLKSKMRVNRVIRHMTGVGGAQRYSKEGDDWYDNTHPLLSDRIRLIERIKSEHFGNQPEEE